MKRKSIGILDYFARHNDAFSAKVGFSRTAGTYERYRIVYRHLKTFVKDTHARDDVPITELRCSFIDEFDVWLRSERGLSPNSVWGYMTVFKHIISLARNEGLIVINPFSSYINAYSPVDRGYLSEDELVKLMAIPARTEIEDVVRDMFLFAAFTGLSYIDVRNLREDNVQRRFDGNWWIITRRQKTRVESNIRLLDVPLRIIDKYRGSMPDERLFPMPSNNCCNENLEKLASRCDIRIHLTFHVGRHTFATLALNRGMPIETLSSILGHTNIRTTQIYAKITNKKISEDMAALADKIKDLKLLV